MANPIYTSVNVTSEPRSYSLPVSVTKPRAERESQMPAPSIGFEGASPWGLLYPVLPVTIVVGNQRVYCSWKAASCREERASYGRENAWTVVARNIRKMIAAKHLPKQLPHAIKRHLYQCSGHRRFQKQGFGHDSDAARRVRFDSSHSSCAPVPRHMAQRIRIEADGLSGRGLASMGSSLQFGPRELESGCGAL